MYHSSALIHEARGGESVQAEAVTAPILQDRGVHAHSCTHAPDTRWVYIHCIAIRGEESESKENPHSNIDTRVTKT